MKSDWLEEDDLLEQNIDKDDNVDIIEDFEDLKDVAQYCNIVLHYMMNMKI